MIDMKRAALKPPVIIVASDPLMRQAFLCRQIRVAGSILLLLSR
ncbi:Hypothetical protein GbCGDNIH9_8682 [Granulibacter bethesdensis]|uniref:Uncharacterized protein n=1 Tax=Granulibacter bethesdensis TaxID=364410 RepID=A0AAC9P9K1_9PROT|nr:Hypothetical protein GbCGDNIH9_8682 [Granulibacter bethesdensis]APH62986.1 Hypothetical protein GbCGDNIH8_8682 [Granulibacter bethesdensis]